MSFWPSHPKNKPLKTKNQKEFFDFKQKEDPFTKNLFRKGKFIKIAKVSAIYATPIFFDGMLRNIAYKGKKYHSGTMWAGVDNESAYI